MTLIHFFFIFPVFSIVKQDFVITCLKGEVQSSHMAIQQKYCPGLMKRDVENDTKRYGSR